MNTRELTPADLPQVAQLEHAVQLDPWTHEQVLAIAPALQVANSAGEYTGAVLHDADGEMLAYVIARVVLDECEILSIGVAQQQQGRGLGQQVLNQLIEQVQGVHQVHQIHLEVRSSNEAALRLYQRMGFVEVGRRKGYYAPIVTDSVRIEREDARLMCKTITTSSPAETTP